MALKFYHGHGSPFSWRVWLALEAKRIPYELEVLSFTAGDTKKPEFVAINPRHQVPTIVDDGFALWESTVILEYLDERFGGAKLYPGDVKQRARVRRLAREAESYLGPEALDTIMEEYFFKGDAAPDLEKVGHAREKLAAELAYFAQELRGDFLDGAAITGADIVMYPYIAYMKRLTVRKPETKLTDLLPPALDAWAKRIEAQPWFDKTFPPHWK
ncbi:MAG TPA: glutathione S-transferase family protein [Usitatibacter sp.]|jgi:glutathione S-transferase|nr:glutathione S-transferase family protein [Usitatibacter sp.]